MNTSIYERGLARAALKEETRSGDVSNALLDVRAVAHLVGVSASWVRRHISELPCVRVGRLVRFDSVLLFRQLQEKIQSGKSLKPERTHMLSRYQRGYVYQVGTKLRVWYGMFREDVRKPDGQIERRQRNVRLGNSGRTPYKERSTQSLI